MTTVSATEARRRLYPLIDEVGQSHQPVQIHGKRGNAVPSERDNKRIDRPVQGSRLVSCSKRSVACAASCRSSSQSSGGWPLASMDWNTR